MYFDWGGQYLMWSICQIHEVKCIQLYKTGISNGKSIGLPWATVNLGKSVAYVFLLISQGVINIKKSCFHRFIRDVSYQLQFTLWQMVWILKKICIIFKRFQGILGFCWKMMFVKFYKNRLISDGEISDKHVLLAGSGTPGYSGGVITKWMEVVDTSVCEHCDLNFF